MRYDAEGTLQRPATFGADGVEVPRMSVDGIAMQILKEEPHGARAET